MVENKACGSWSFDREGAWASIEFVDDVMVKPTKFTLSHCSDVDDYIRSWAFEGSRDGEQWALIREHSNDRSLNASGQSHSWETPNVDGYFNRFRVRMTGENSDGGWELCAHALEIYGFVQKRT